MNREQVSPEKRASAARERGRNSGWRLASSASSHASRSPSSRSRSAQTPSRFSGRNVVQVSTVSDSAGRRSPRLVRSQPGSAKSFARNVDRNHANGDLHGDLWALPSQWHGPEVAAAKEYDPTHGLTVDWHHTSNRKRATSSPIQFSSMPSSRILTEEKFQFDSGTYRSRLPARSLREQILCEKIAPNPHKPSSTLSGLDGQEAQQPSDTTRAWLMRLQRLECDISSDGLGIDHAAHAHHMRQAFFESIWVGHRTGALALRKTFTVWSCLGTSRQKPTNSSRREGCLYKVENILEHCYSRSMQHHLASVIRSWTQMIHEERHARELHEKQEETSMSFRHQEICMCPAQTPAFFESMLPPMAVLSFKTFE